MKNKDTAPEGQSQDLKKGEDVTVMIHGSGGLTQKEVEKLEPPLSRYSQRLREAANKLKKR